MPEGKTLRLECHIKFNGRNIRHVEAARALASVENKYKTSFIALAIEQYMDAHPLGISLDELMAVYRKSERAYRPKATIAENRQKPRCKPPAVAPASMPTAEPEDAEAGGAIDKAMDFYDVS